ncbi:leucine-rich repeat domain-containing protein [Chloroflexota bacterium]
MAGNSVIDGSIKAGQEVHITSASGFPTEDANLSAVTTLENYGALRSIYGDGGYRTISADINNHPGATVVFSWPTDMTGVFTNSGTVSFAGVYLSMTGAGQVFNQESGGVLSSGATQEFSVLLKDGATFNFNGGSFSGGTSPLIYDSNLNLGAGATNPAIFRMTGNSVIDGLIKAGQEIHVTSVSGLPTTDANLFMAGLVENYGTIKSLEGNNGGTREISIEHFYNHGILHIEWPTKIIGAIFTNDVDGILKGNALLDLSFVVVTNEGTITPGLSIGTLSITGVVELTSSGNLFIEIGGETSFPENDQLEIVGDIYLAGDLYVDVIPPFVPTIGDAFVFLAYSTSKYEFDNIVALNPLYSWEITYLSNYAVLRVVINDPPVVGDIPDQTIDEGGSFTTVILDNYVNDPDNADEEISWTYSGNTDLIVSIDEYNVATITTPNLGWYGAEAINFRATDPGTLWDEDSATFTVNPPVVTFPDANLETVIRDAIKKPTGDIYPAYLLPLVTLDASGQGIIDLTGLEWCVNLTTLYLNDNQINDISPLTGLTSLMYLNLRDNQINDISVLQNLTSLTDLRLRNNQISDISSLSGLTSLTTLFLGSNQIGNNISPLQYLSNLTILGLVNNQISDISTLQDLTNLTNLYLINNEISDILPIKSLTNLIELLAGGNQISDISSLQNLTNLTSLGLNNNQVNDILPIQGLTNLTILYLNNNQINDLSPLQNLTNLIELSLVGNEISDLQPLVDNEGLATGDIVYLEDNPLSSISLVSLIPALEARGVVVSYSPPVDSDGDGIRDDVDTVWDTPSDDFRDDATKGSIITRGDQLLTIIDAAELADGVRITADPSGGDKPAEISLSGGAELLSLNAGREVIVTEGSVSLEVIVGPIDATLVGDDGTIATLSVPTDYGLTFYPDTLEITAFPDNPGPIYLFVVGDPSGEPISVEPDTTTTLPYIVDIDIKPGSAPNSINMGSHGVVPVAILTTNTFDAATVDPSTITLADAMVRIKGKSGNARSLEDVDGDGDLDLVVHVYTEQLALSEGEVVAILEGFTYDGTPIRGSDSVNIVP